MRRDMELIRAILLKVEENDDPLRDMRLTIEGQSDLAVSYHVKLLHEHGLITAIDFSSHDGLHWRPKSLTWEGHEFLDAARNENVWAKAKEQIAERGGSFPFELVKDLLVQIASSVLRGGL